MNSSSNAGKANMLKFPAIVMAFITMGMSIFCAIYYKTFAADLAFYLILPALPLSFRLQNEERRVQQTTTQTNVIATYIFYGIWEVLFIVYLIDNLRVLNYTFIDTSFVIPSLITCIIFAVTGVVGAADFQLFKMFKQREVAQAAVAGPPLLYNQQQQQYPTTMM